ncbi:MAG: winged helix-turn-helix transcriptional regulator [Ignavibacteriaceae bacterium]|nr:metalloregulator ArsR/SmtB family transcription factor [Ignavibacteriaceae bacterium]NUM72600.1 winged helix-turn-helix transcriptional regulator [Ignavibacteriaceae bacterium]
MKSKINIFKVLSDNNRIRILKMLQQRELCVCEITSVLKLATSTVSQHLGILKESGFISEVKDGKWVNYRLNYSAADPRITAFLASLDFWTSGIGVIDNDREELKSVDRYQICG